MVPVLFAATELGVTVTPIRTARRC